MESFWAGFDKRASAYNSEKVAFRGLGRSLGRGVEKIKGSITKGVTSTTSGSKNLINKVKNAPKNFREGYRSGRNAVKNEAALSAPISKSRGQYPGNVKPTTSSSTKAQHYRDTRAEKGLPAYGADKKKSSTADSLSNKRDFKAEAKSFASKNKVPLAAGAAGIGAGVGLSNMRKKEQQPSYYR